MPFSSSKHSPRLFRAGRRPCPSLIAGICLLICTIAGAHADDAVLGRSDALWLERITYGLDSATVQRFHQLGRRAFLDEQLAAKTDALPAPVQARIDAFDITRLSPPQLIADEVAERERMKSMDGADLAQLRKQRNTLGDHYLDETVQRQLLRATYSPAQLKEQMSWFWLNHFSVFARKGAIRWLAADYEEHAIRPHALGHFRDLLMATLRHPAMLQYLDNAQNAAGHINENYARELMELHTLGVDGGYTQQDVQELARVLTGVGIALKPDMPRFRPQGQRGAIRDGAFAFYPARHDFGDKTLLGHTIRGQGFAEVEQAVDLLVKQPACARFISRQLAEYFVADEPPTKLVEAMAHTFQHSDGDIAAVLRTLFESREFDASLGTKFKDPMHYVVSSVRLAYDGRTVSNAQPLANWLNGQREAPFGHQSPDGYPLVENAWASSGQLSRRFEIARSIARGNLLAPIDGSPPAMPDFASASNRLYVEGIAPYLSKTTLVALTEATSPLESNTFLLASPEFNYR
ncbi:MAG: DUF1800 domain-containing protein [Rudaea sp.]|nr:DUF1800 domain-containing protein [Rudaea sp.]